MYMLIAYHMQTKKDGWRLRFLSEYIAIRPHGCCIYLFSISYPLSRPSLKRAAHRQAQWRFKQPPALGIGKVDANILAV